MIVPSVGNYGFDYLSERNTGKSIQNRSSNIKSLSSNFSDTNRSKGVPLSEKYHCNNAISNKIKKIKAMSKIGNGYINTKKNNALSCLVERLWMLW